MTVFENPFYLLGAATRDDRWKISALADEKTSYADANAVAAARGILTDPQKRLPAELRWFPGLGKEELVKIIGFFDALKSGQRPPVPALPNQGILAPLNLRVYAFPLWNFETDSELKQIILDINRLFEAATVETVKTELNRDRLSAGFLPVTDDFELKNALRIYRDEIRQILHNKISALPKDRYLKLAADLSASAQTGGVLDDIFMGYEIDVMPEVKGQKQQIWALISAVKNGDAQSANELASTLAMWNPLVLPLQAAAKRHGQRHPDSEEITNAVHDLTAELNSRGSLPEVLLPFATAGSTAPEPETPVQNAVYPQPAAQAQSAVNPLPIQLEDNAQTQQESLYRNRLDKRYSVYLSADKVTIPPFCTCCMKPTALVETVSGSASQNVGGKTATRTVSINMPICPDCLEHRKKAKQANWIPLAVASLIGLASTLGFGMLFTISDVAFWVLPILVAAAAYVLLGLLFRLPQLGGEHSAMQQSTWIGGVQMQDNHILYIFTNWRYANLFAKANALQQAGGYGEVPHVIEEPYRNRTKRRTYFRAAEHTVGIGALSLVVTAALLLAFGSKLSALSGSLFVVPTAAPASSAASSIPASSLPESSILSSVPVSSAPESSAASSSKASSVRSSAASSSKASSAAKSSETTSSKPVSSAPASSTVTSSKASSVRSSSITSSVRSSSTATSSKTSSVDYDALNEQQRQAILDEINALMPQLNAAARQVDAYEAALDQAWAKYQQSGSQSDYDAYNALYDEYSAYFDYVYVPLLNQYQALVDEYNSLNPKGL